MDFTEVGGKSDSRVSFRRRYPHDLTLDPGITGYFYFTPVSIVNCKRSSVLFFHHQIFYIDNLTIINNLFIIN